MNKWVWVLALTGAILTGNAVAEKIGLSEEEFFRSLDLDRPNLAAARTAVETKDWAAARKAFADHIRQREKPYWHFNWRDRPAKTNSSGSSEKRTGAAEEALRHRFTVCGLAHEFIAADGTPGPIDWAFNPTAQPGSPNALNHEWTWQFNRHSFWAALGQAYWKTGDERYAGEFVRQMLDWVEHNPVPEEGANQKSFSRWRTIEAGIRMGQTWPEAFFRFLSSPSFTDDAVCAMVRSMAEHARYLRAYPTARNWLTMEMSGLFTVGALFPELRDASDWTRFAAERMRQELDTQVYPDGAQVELAPGYHGVALKNFCLISELARLDGYALPDGYDASLERMFAFFMWVAAPDRSLPPFNDSGVSPGAAVAALRSGLEYFPERADFLWMTSEGKEGTPPAETSYAFPYAGIVIERSGWDLNARYLAFEAGPFGAGHQHEDKLSFVLDAYGRRLVAEGGVYMYDASQWRKYVLGPYAHNVIFVDGMGQRRRGVESTYIAKEPVPYVWKTTPEYDYVAASYGSEQEGFGDNHQWTATHTRRILFVKTGKTVGDFWVVADTLTPRDEQSHKYESVFHLDAPDVETDPKMLSVRTTHPDGANLGLFPLVTEGLKLDVIKGQETPVVQGWLPVRSKTSTGVRPIPTPTYTVEGAGVKQLLYVFYPVPQPPVPAVTLAAWFPPQKSASDGLGAEIGFADGAQYHVFFPSAADGPLLIEKTKP